MPILKIHFLDDVEWNNPGTELSMEKFQTTIFRVDIEAMSRNLNEFYSILQENEKERANRYLQVRDHNRSIISRGALRILLARFLNLEPSEINLKKDQNKKLYVEETGFSGIKFNVSHSGKWILISLDDRDNGVDIEQVNAFFTYQNLLPLTCSQQEQLAISNSTEPVQSFFEMWTRKEALLKATGTGITDELARIPAVNGTHQSPAAIISSEKDWTVTSFWVDANHIASVAIEAGRGKKNFFNFQL